MAHIQRKGSSFIVRHRTPDGRERSKSFPSKAEARAYRAELEHSRYTGSYIDPKAGRIAFGPYAERWLASRIGIRDTTRAAQESYLRSLILPALGEYPLDAITPDDLRDWIASLDRRGSAPATIRKALLITKKILDRAVADRRIGHNPAASLEILDAPPVQRKTMRTLTANEVGELVRASGPFYGAMIHTAAATGMRWGEIAGLRTSELDLLRGEIRIESQLREIAGTLTLDAPLKTASSRRIVTIDGGTAEMIGAHLARFPNNEGVAFSTVEGKLLRRSNFARSHFKPAARSIGRGELTFHDLRHTHASLLLAAGEPITNVADRLGHRDAATTLRIYAHAIEGTQRSAADRIGSILPAGFPRDGAAPDDDGGIVIPLRA